MKVACIIQARLRSTRLPAKVLLPLPTGRTVLEECLHRCRAIPGVDVVVAAIADDEGSDLLVPYAQREQVWVPHIIRRNDPKLVPIEIVRGPEDDVLARYLKAAEHVKADVILRVTSDCPLIEPEICATVLAGCKNTSERDFARDLKPLQLPVYTANNLEERTFPHGLDCEAFNITALRLAAEDHSPENREHVTHWMRSSSRVTRLGLKHIRDESHVRWTLDTIDDYVTICSEFNRRIAERSVTHPQAARSQ